ncbi:MAG: hypothetical protein AAFX87_27390 [Bacteroidota bacterium]
MIKIGVIGDSIDRTFFQHYPLLLEHYICIDKDGYVEAEFGREDLIDWIKSERGPDEQIWATDTTRIISIFLQSLSAYGDIVLSIAQVPQYPEDSAMKALNTSLEWMEETVQPDYVHINFSNQEGRYQKEQNAWVEKLNQRGCKVICPAGIPPAFPAQLDQVISVADQGFIEAGFAITKPDIIIEEKHVPVYENGGWVYHDVSTETASAMALGQILKQRIQALPQDGGPLVELPDLTDLSFPSYGQAGKAEQPMVAGKPSFILKVRRYLRSMASRMILPTGRVPRAIKATRKLSCNGDGQNIAPCHFRVRSEKQQNAFICGACGCGDSKDVLVDGDVPKFEKLDYPYLHCPACMPGFSNYLPSEKEWKPDQRKTTIEKEIGVEALLEQQHQQQEINERLQKRLGWLNWI